jgi:hypothetical protein
MGAPVARSGRSHHPVRHTPTPYLARRRAMVSVTLGAEWILALHPPCPNPTRGWKQPRALLAPPVPQRQYDNSPAPSVWGGEARPIPAGRHEAAKSQALRFSRLLPPLP